MPSGAALQETFDLNSGGHTLIALRGGQTLTSLGDDKMTGSATGSTTFVLDAIYGADTITNLTSSDIVSMPIPNSRASPPFRARPRLEPAPP